jgi:predicted O-methyltransferase YrrM
VIGTEYVPAKAASARHNLRRAGLEAWVDVREGDALETLQAIDEPVDLLLNDGFPRFALPVLELVAPHMRLGAIASLWQHGDLSSGPQRLPRLGL